LRLRPACFCAWFWEFGPPGHVKGVWDEIGALIKRTVRQDIIDDRPHRRTIRTESGRIASARDVAEHVKKRFDEQWTAKQMHKTLNKIVITYADTAEVEATRPKPDHECASFVNMQKTFCFLALSPGVVAQRAFACWCPACVHAAGRGQGLRTLTCRSRTASGSSSGPRGRSSPRTRLAWPMHAAARERTPRLARTSWSVPWELPAAASGWRCRTAAKRTPTNIGLAGRRAW
jgi:hypothetical protein